jgi:hypothetical protein
MASTERFEQRKFSSGGHRDAKNSHNNALQPACEDARCRAQTLERYPLQQISQAGPC